MMIMISCTMGVMPAVDPGVDRHFDDGLAGVQDVIRNAQAHSQDQAVLLFYAQFHSSCPLRSGR